MEREHEQERAREREQEEKRIESQFSLRWSGEGYALSVLTTGVGVVTV
jgi:hypothetical protein